MRRIIMTAVMVLSACSSSVRGSRTMYEPSEPQSTQTDVWQVELTEPVAGLITAYMGFDEGEGWDGGDAMEPLSDRPYAFWGRMRHGSAVLITIEIESQGIGVCGENKADYCGPVRLWTDRHSPGELTEVQVRFTSLKTNPVLDDQVSCEDKAIKLDHWRDYRCVYSAFAFE